LGSLAHAASALTVSAIMPSRDGLVFLGSE
jgi:hypothetical protein